MNDEQLKAVADRQRRLDAGEDLFRIYANFVDPELWEHADRCKLRDAYLAEHPADDDEPITRKWLLSIGFIDNHSPHQTVSLRYGPDFEIDHHCYITWDTRDGVLIGGSSTGSPLWWRNEPTKGKMRRLIRALKSETEDDRSDDKPAEPPGFVPPDPTGGEDPDVPSASDLLQVLVILLASGWVILTLTANCSKRN